MRIRTQTSTHNQIADHEEWRNKVLLGNSLGGGVQTNGPPDVCVFVSTGDHVWVCARGMDLYFESENDCLSVAWRRNPWYQYRPILNIDLCVYLSIYPRARHHTHTHIPYVYLSVHQLVSHRSPRGLVFARMNEI